MTMKEKSPARETRSGVMANTSPGLVADLRADAARTIASRQESVRSSAQEFQIPAAQFSVSKYQLIPQMGTVAAMMAESGRPICSPRLRAEPKEYRARRRRIEKRSRRIIAVRTAFRTHPRRPAGTLR